MRILSATVALLSAVSIAAPALAAPGSTSPLPPPAPVSPLPGASATPQPLTMEAKAGCGVALVALEQAATRMPGAFGKVPEEDRKMTLFMMQVMGRQGQAYLDEAFAEGARRNMTPTQVYTAGVADMMSHFPTDTDGDSAGEAFAARFMARCLMPAGAP